MLSEETQERLAEQLVDRIEELNTTILEEIGKSIKKLGTLSPSQAYRVAQALKYGSSKRKIIKKLAEVTKLNQKDIKSILDEVARKNVEFSKPYFDYRKIDFVPYEKNIALQRQVKAIEKLTRKRYANIMRTAAFKMTINGKAVYTPISKIYQKTLDRAVISVIQGQESYQSAMRRTMRELAENGIVVAEKDVSKVEYATGYKRRLDSSVRMNILDGMKQVANEMQQQLGEKFGADGVEISVHENPAPDHKDIQGKQYSKKDFEELNKSLKRPISTMNCYHYIFSVILGVNKPQYSEEQLKAINERNEKGFNFEGKKYTMYQGTQLQRAIESKIRTLKDNQIGSRARGDKKEVGRCQEKIRILTNKYDKLCKTSGLQPRKVRLSVSGYHKIKV